MRAVRFHGYGGPEVLRVEDVPRPEPGPAEVLVEVAAAGVTLPVVRLTRGDPDGGGVGLPHTPGGEVVGRIAAVGPAVTGWRIGQRVVAMAFTGAYAEFAAVPSGMVTAVPDGIDDAAALALVRSGQVALGALRAGGLTDPATGSPDGALTVGSGAGVSVLVTGAAGGVGHLAVQLARVLGACRVVGAVGAAAKQSFVDGLGVDATVTYGRPPQEWGGPFDVVLDGVGGPVQAACLRVLAPLGRLVAYNAVGGVVDVNDLRQRSQAIVGFAMAHVAGRRDVYARHQQELWELCLGGALRPVHRALPLEEAAEAHRIVEARENRGKLVLTVTP